MVVFFLSLVVLDTELPAVDSDVEILTFKAEVLARDRKVSKVFGNVEWLCTYIYLLEKKIVRGV